MVMSTEREREIDRLKGLKYNWMNGERERDIGEMDKNIQNHIDRSVCKWGQLSTS